MNDFVGIDVPKARLDVHRTGSDQSHTFTHDAQGVEELLQILRSAPPRLIVLEATADLERALVAALIAAGLPVAVDIPARYATSPRPVALGQDRSPRCAGAGPLRPGDPAGAASLAGCRCAGVCRSAHAATSVVEMLVMEKTRSKQAPNKLVRRDIKRHRYLETACAPASRISHAVESSPVWQAQRDLLSEIKGIGEVTVIALIAALPELGQLDEEYAPWSAWHVRPRQRHLARQTRRLGRARGRAPCAVHGHLTAVRCDPVIRRFTHACAATAKWPKSRSSPSCASSSPSSMPWFATAKVEPAHLAAGPSTTHCSPASGRGQYLLSLFVRIADGSRRALEDFCDALAFRRVRMPALAQGHFRSRRADRISFDSANSLRIRKRSRARDPSWHRCARADPGSHRPIGDARRDTRDLRP